MNWNKHLLLWNWGENFFLKKQLASKLLQLRSNHFFIPENWSFTKTTATCRNYFPAGFITVTNDCSLVSIHMLCLYLSDGAFWQADKWHVWYFCRCSSLQYSWISATRGLGYMVCVSGCSIFRFRHFWSCGFWYYCSRTDIFSSCGVFSSRLHLYSCLPTVSVNWGFFG